MNINCRFESILANHRVFVVDASFAQSLINNKQPVNDDGGGDDHYRKRYVRVEKHVDPGVNARVKVKVDARVVCGRVAVELSRLVRIKRILHGRESHKNQKMKIKQKHNEHDHADDNVRVVALGHEQSLEYRLVRAV